MSTSKASAGPADRFKRHKTRHRGITYRLRADGSRVYSVYCKGRYVQVEGGEREALALQAELRGKIARGQQVSPTKVTFAEVAEQWLESKRQLRPVDAQELPRFARPRPVASVRHDEDRRDHARRMSPS